MPTDRAGNNRNKAKSIGSMSGSKTLGDRIGGADKHDFYQFTLNNSSSFNLSLNGLKANADLHLLNQVGQLLQKSTRKGKSSESIATTLGAGTYFIRVQSRDRKATKYKLSLSSVPIPTSSITVISPNGGNSLTKGNGYFVSWNDNIDDNVRIDLFKGGIYSSNIIPSVPSNGSYYWTVPTPITDGSDYQIRISSISNPSLGDYSDTTFSIVSTQSGIPTNRWKVDYFNNPSLQGNPVLSEDRGDGSQALFVDWGFGAPTGVPVDGFSTRSTTNRPLAAGLYKVTTNADDGIRVTVGSGWRVIDKWIDQGNENTHSGFFRWEGGNLPIIVEHYENGGGASVKVSITPHTTFDESIPPGNWLGGVYAWNGAQSLPPADPLGSFYASTNSKIATLNLGSNNLGSTQGINMDLGTGALKGNGAALPHDNFVVRAYTAATLEQGATYNFQVRSDDGYEIFAKNQVTNQWVYITPQGQWQTDAYGGKNFSFTMNGSSGLYDMHFLYQETLGDSYFNLSWAKANVANNLLHSNPSSSNPLRGFRHPLLGAGSVTQPPGGSTSHTGRNAYAIDYGVGVGTPVYAMYSGTVVGIQQNVADFPPGVQGGPANINNVNYVLIKLDDQDGVDDNYRALYLHIKQNSVSVNVGQRVNAGDLIAQSGHNGYSTGPHLHVEVHRPIGSNGWGQTVPFQID